jgi:DNA-directed RNA polymerase subunit H (RpoH/RPB5)
MTNPLDRTMSARRGEKVPELSLAEDDGFNAIGQAYLIAKGALPKVKKSKPDAAKHVEAAVSSLNEASKIMLKKGSKGALSLADPTASTVQAITNKLFDLHGDIADVANNAPLQAGKVAAQARDKVKEAGTLLDRVKKLLTPMR